MTACCRRPVATLVVAEPAAAPIARFQALDAKFALQDLLPLQSPFVL